MRTSFGFASSQRLNSALAFSAVFEKGKRFHLKNGMFLILSNEQQRARLGTVIAKKKLRLAVQRNYLKRIIREGFRLHQHQLAGYDVVFVANHKTAQLDQKTLWLNVKEDWSFLSKRYKKLS